MEAVYVDPYKGPSTRELVNQALKATPDGQVLSYIILTQEEWDHMIAEYNLGNFVEYQFQLGDVTLVSPAGADLKAIAAAQIAAKRAG